MSWLIDLLPYIIAPIITLLLGMILKTTRYIKGKMLLKLIHLALQDNKITPEELQDIINLFRRE